MQRVPRMARASPTRAPKPESTRLSASTCRIKRFRPAPRAARTAVSLWRAVERASNKLERLAQTRSCLSENGVALPIYKVDCKIGVERGLAWVCRRTFGTFESETREELGLVRDFMIEP